MDVPGGSDGGRSSCSWISAAAEETRHRPLRQIVGPRGALAQLAHGGHRDPLALLADDTLDVGALCDAGEHVLAQHGERVVGQGAALRFLATPHLRPTGEAYSAVVAPSTQATQRGRHAGKPTHDIAQTSEWSALAASRSGQVSPPGTSTRGCPRGG